MIDQSTRNRLQRNWQAVQHEVHEAAERSGRSPESITIVGVSKYVDFEVTEALFEAGCVNLAESRPQNLWKKAEAFGSRDAVCWHLIGHLQRNKIRRTLPIQPLIHSVDSQRLLDALAEEAQSQGVAANCLLEVNVSGDDAKTGMSKEGLNELLSQLPIGGLRIDGLMAMAGWGTDPDHARRQFDQLRQIRDDVEKRYALQLPQLSMGMSGDFLQAISAGATMVRIGSRLFEGVIERQANASLGSRNPGGKSEPLWRAHDGTLRVTVTAPADQGKANKAIAKLLAKALGIQVRQVSLISGNLNRRKTFEIDEDVSVRVTELMQA